MREIIIERGEGNRKNAEMPGRAKVMESEEKELKKKVFQRESIKGHTKQNLVH